MKKFLFAFILLFTFNLVNAAMNPYPPFCEHQGYVYNRTDARCYFGDGNSCEIMEFYNGSCGSEYIREFPCVELGKPVFHYEECCDGEAYLKPGVIGQTYCQIVSEQQKFMDNMEFFYHVTLGPNLPIIIIAVLAVTVYFFKFRK